MNRQKDKKVKNIGFVQFVLLAFLLLSCYIQFGAVASKIRKPTSNEKVNEEKPSCLDLEPGCLNNTACKSSLKTVKKKCKSNGNQCSAGPNIQHKCFEEIDFLKTTTFQNCGCRYKYGYGPKKMMKCFRIRNAIHANPCYDLPLENRRHLTSSPSPTVGNAISHTSSKTSTLDVEHDTTPSHQPQRPVVNRLLEEDWDILDQLMAGKNPIIKPFVTKPPYVVEDDDVNGVDDVSEKTIESPDNKGNRPDSDVDYYQDKNTNDDNAGVGGAKSALGVNDVNANEVAKVVKKIMEISSRPAQDHASETNFEFEEDEERIQPEPSLHLKYDNDSFSLSSLHITLICVSSAVLLLILLGLFLLRSRRAKQSNFLSSTYLNKSCRSAVIVKSTYDDNDLYRGRKADHV